MLLQFMLAAIVFLVSYISVSANSSIFINEFIVDSPQTVEILNKGAENVDISGWYIDDSGGSTYYTIPANSILYASSCLVFYGDFNFNKSSPDSVRLFDKTAPPTDSINQLVDSYNYKSATESGISFKRIPDGSGEWVRGPPTFGKFNEGNTTCRIDPTPTITPTITIISVESSPTPQTIPVTFDHVYISEVLPYPEKDQNEWVELYNDNDFSVNLEGWYIDDIYNGGSSPKTFMLTLDAKKYGVIDIATSMFNNDEDSIILLDSQKNIKDSLEYGFTKQDKSLGRTSWESDTLCLQEPSRGSVNNSCIQLTSTPAPTIKLQSSVIPTKTSLSPTIKPLYNFSTAEFSQSFTSTNPQPTGEVLSVSNQVEKPHFVNASIKAFSFASFSYALLAAFSLLIKIKSYFV